MYQSGYNLEDTNISSERLITLILLIAIAYSSATIEGQKIKRKGVQKYVGRVEEVGRIERSPTLAAVTKTRKTNPKVSTVINQIACVL